MSEEKTISVEELNAALAEQHEIAQAEKALRARKKAVSAIAKQAMKHRRSVVENELAIKEPTASGYDRWTKLEAKKAERRLVVDAIIKAHAAGKVVIPALDVEA